MAHRACTLASVKCLEPFEPFDGGRSGSKRRRAFLLENREFVRALPAARGPEFDPADGQRAARPVEGQRL